MTYQPGDKIIYYHGGWSRATVYYRLGTIKAVHPRTVELERGQDWLLPRRAHLEDIRPLDAEVWAKLAEIGELLKAKEAGAQALRESRHFAWETIPHE
jgi:hypothetical protein